MNIRKLGGVVLAIMMLAVLACSISFGGDSGLDETALLQTAVAATVAANQAAQPPANTQAPVVEQPTAQPTSQPTATLPQPPTETPQPCNKAEFISETVPDGTEMAYGQAFDKTWRLKNVGTCTWNTNYQIVFAEGDKMSGPATKNLTQQVKPGEMTDISVSLKAPNTAGTYRGYWKVRDDQGAFFVNNIYVEIVAKNKIAELIPLLPVMPLFVLKPDLAIANFEITPATPNMGENTHVKVRAKNIGTLNSGGFTVKWYGLDTFADPSCTWNVAGGLVADGSVWLECDFVFASWYPINKTTVVYIDTANTVAESDEGNNAKTKSPFGVNP